MQMPEVSRRQAGPRVACSDPPPADGTTPAFALPVEVLIVAPQASTTPAPVAAVALPGSALADVTSRCFTWFGVSQGDLPRSSAAAPETMPVENDVPEPLP